MKQKLLLLFSICAIPALLPACKKETCMSCIARSRTGVLMKHVIECDKSTSYLAGFEDGLTSFYKTNGDSVTVTCISKKAND